MLIIHNPVYLLVIADTHVSTIEQLPSNLVQLVKDADWVVHCGDFTEMQVVRELRNLSRQFIGVYGNTDSPEIKQTLPYESFFEIQGRRFVVTHPFFGGPPWGLEDELAAKYPNADVIFFGHTHDALIVEKNGTMLVNPGQGYPIFLHQATVGIVKIIDSQVEARIDLLENVMITR
jgi:putative phosphoesterase